MKHTEQGDLISSTQSDLPPFRLVQPRSLAEILDALADSPEPVVFHAGGTDLFAKLRTGLRLATLISLGAITDLQLTNIGATEVELGAGLTHRAAIDDPAVRMIPGLAEAWAQIATVRIRHIGTLGGNLMARHTRYELSILMSALGAKARLVGPAGERLLPVEALWDTDLTQTPLLLSVLIPRTGAPQLDYERSMRPRFTQALCRRDGDGGPRLRLAMGTEYLRPWIADFDTEPAPETVLARLPDDFGDHAVSRSYLTRAGSVFLRRQRIRLENAV